MPRRYKYKIYAGDIILFIQYLKNIWKIGNEAIAIEKMKPKEM